ncbi:alpha/beta fold hydrolase [Neobacillus ginsengisoli]|uniref:Pimeloyl-ACP methyl ester carboxylesterase n=1 Tax=Neobacillus ginsengisoli TaxID=904295 RepID=A0ABT9Y0L7_9BACI|nr:alpha/beta hydrolase [Neobacillus ginsengisoli]MDQ0201355.1 pimeloyl-ACP methyl ester carboxylesterase [Neobacillus ginsengisoli]
METKKLSMENSKLTYLDQGEGKPIILLHGFCGSSGYWEKVIPRLAENNRVIAPDLPGHGGSSLFKETFTIEKLADLLKEFLDELKLQNVTMFGHSLGGYITLAFAEKYSDRLNGFSLVHSTAFPDSDEAKKGRAANVEKVMQNGIHSLIDGLVPKLFSPDHLDKEYVATAKTIGYGTLPQGAMSTLLAMKDRPNRNHVLEGTDLPVLLVAGEKDQIIPSEKTFSVTKGNIKQIIIKDSGHMSMYENPDALLNEIQGFLLEIEN